MAKIKSMGTLLEKIKKGDVSKQTNYKSFFSNVIQKEKSDLIKPYLHALDKQSLNLALNSVYVNDDSVLRELYNDYKVQFPSKAKSIGHAAFITDARSVYNKLPKELIFDIYNQYYNNIQVLRYSDRSLNNKNRYRIIDKFNNPITKIMSNNSSIKSFIFTKYSLNYILSMLVTLKDENPEDFEKFMNALSNNNPTTVDNKPPSSSSPQKTEDANQQESEGETENQKSGNGNGMSTTVSDDFTKSLTPDDGSFTEQENTSNGSRQSGAGSGSTYAVSLSKQFEKIVKNYLENTDKTTNDGNACQSLLDTQIEQAKIDSKNLESVLSQEELGEMWKTFGNSTGDKRKKAILKTDSKYLNKIQSELSSISMNTSAVKNKIKNLVDKSISFFSAKEINYYDNFIESPKIDELIDMELLHPKFRNVMIEDMLVKETKRIGKIDVYVDVSGSMSSSAQIEQDGRDLSISRLTFAKALVLKLKQLDLVNEVYSFENRVHKEGNKLIDILSLDGNGGTELNKVIDRIIFNDKNALIITDAEDNCCKYSDKAFFIGVSGARFNSFDTQVLREYHSKKQMVIFDGNRVLNVNEKGYAIK